MLYVPGILGAATAGRWALLSVGVPVAVCLSAGVRFTRGHLLGLLLLAWAAVSLSWTASIYDGIHELWQWCLYGGLFCLAASAATLRPVYIGLGLGFAVNGALMIAQHTFGFIGIEQIVPPAGLFMNKNYVAEPAALVLVALVGHRLWWLAAAVLPAVVLGGSRGALVGIAAAAVVWLWPRSRAAAVVLTAAGVCACAALVSGGSVAERFTIWRDTVDGLTWLGSGIGSFFTQYPMAASLKDLLISRPANAHNDFLEMAFEIGPAGLLMFVLLLSTALCAPRPIERAVLLAFIMEACFGFPLHNPVTGFIAALAAGHLCGARHGLCDDFARWRMALRARALANRAPSSRDCEPTSRPVDIPA